MVRSSKDQVTAKWCVAALLLSWQLSWHLPAIVPTSGRLALKRRPATVGLFCGQDGTDVDSSKVLLRSLWSDLNIAPSELNASHTLGVGQCFHWKYIGEQQQHPTWVGCPVQNMAIELRQMPTTVEVKSLTGQKLDLRALKEYFNIGTGQPPLKDLYRHWCTVDGELALDFQQWPGSRTLRQEPIEALVSYIALQKNNVKRATLMLDRLRRAFGKQVAVLPANVSARRETTLYTPRTTKGLGHIEEFNGHKELFQFPSLERLAKVSEKELFNLGFGYRSKYIPRTAAKLQEEGGLEVLRQLQQGTRQEAERALQRYSGVGPKVASAVALLALGFDDAVSVDVHMKRVVTRLAPPDLAERVQNAKSISPAFHEEISNTFRKKFGERAGLAQRALYARQVALGGLGGA